MNKFFLFAFLVIALLAVAGLASAKPRRLAKFDGDRLGAQENVECHLCIDFMVAAVNYYLNEWLNVGMPQTCSKLCSIVDPSHNGTCNLMCEVFGLYEFIQIISQVDIDPIYYCQLAKQRCPINDCTAPTCAVITGVQVKPNPPKRGQTLTVTGYYSVKQSGGAGMLRLMSETGVNGGWTKGPTDYLVSAYEPGNYKAEYTIDTSQLQPGTWTSTFYVCQGECGSKWPHSRLYAKATVAWTMPN